MRSPAVVRSCFTLAVAVTLALAAACSSSSSSSPPPPPPPPAQQITLTGTLGAGVVLARMGAAAATSALAGYQLTCATLAPPPETGTAAADASGAFSLVIAAQGVPLGCFILDPGGTPVASLEFAQGGSAGTSASFGASASLGNVAVDLGTGLATATVTGGSIMQTPPGAACPAGTWAGSGGPSPTPPCPAGETDAVSISVLPRPGGTLAVDLVTGPTEIFQGTTSTCAHKSLAGVPASWAGGALTIGPLPAGGGCDHRTTIVVTPDSACQTATAAITFHGCGSCGQAPNWCQGSATGACGTATCTGTATLGRQYLTCTPGWSCTPANPCHFGVTACNAAASSCTESGSRPDGTICGAGMVCTAGTCSAGSRTVSGAFTVISWTDAAAAGLANPSSAAAPQPTGTSVAALVPTASGYDVHAGSLLPDGTFTIPGVPAQSYLLEVAPPSGAPAYYELTTSTPDMSLLVSQRPDLALATLPTPVTFNVTGLDPWLRGGLYAGDLFRVVSAQGGASQRPMTIGGGGQPADGATSWSGTSDWIQGSDGFNGNGLPEAVEGDVVYLYQLAHGTTATAAVTRNATRYASLANVSLLNGVAVTISASLVPAPQTGILDGTDVRLSQFDALAPQVNPGAVRDAFAVSVYGMPALVTFPMPRHAVAQLALLTEDLVGAAAPADANLGSSTYGQFLDPQVFAEFRQAEYDFDVTFTAPGATTPGTFVAGAYSWAAMTPAPPVTVAPALSPPTSPMVNGLDAFTARTGVGLTPLLAWSAPALGSPTSYSVTLLQLQNGAGVTGWTNVLTATVRGGTTSFRVPPGLLQAGQAYFADIAANRAPWDVTDAPPLQAALEGGVPFDSADCVTAAFTP